MSESTDQLLSSEQTALLVEHLKTKAGIGACPMCASRSWMTGPIVQAPVYYPGRGILSGQAVPLATIICAQCSFVASFSATKLGLVPTEKLAAGPPTQTPPSTGGT